MAGGAASCATTPAGGYTVSTTVGAFVDVCARTTSTKVLMGADDAVATATLPFPLSFWGARPFMHAVQIHSNGLISFDATRTSPTTGILPDTSSPDGVVAPWWIDLRTSTTHGVCHEALGTVGVNRRWVVQWRDVTYPSDPTNTMDFEVTFFENHTIEFSYRALAQPPEGRVPTVGLESPTGVAAAAVCNPFMERCAVAPMQTVRFTPAM